MGQMIKAIAVLFAVANASCSTLGLGKGNKQTPEVVVETKTKTVIEKEYLPGRTVLQPYADIPEDRFPSTVPYLSDEYLTGPGDDIGGKSAVAVGINWAEQYHDLGKIYLGFYNWYLGLKAGQVEAQKAIDAENPDAPKE